MNNTWQSALWALVELPGRWGDVFIAVLALTGAIVLLVKMILPHAHEPFSLLQFSRIIIGIALLGAALTALNWGWVKITLWLFVIGNATAVFLIATNWCERKDKSVGLGIAMYRWVDQRLFNRAQPHKREDVL